MDSQYQQVSYLDTTSNDVDQRLDNYLFKHLKSIPKTRIYKLLRTGQVRVNKKRVKPAYRIQLGDQVRLPPLVVSEQKPKKLHYYLVELLQQRLLYEDDELLILNKPSGIPVHGGTGVDQGIAEHLTLAFPGNDFLQLAHRLDRETSGCLVIAKNRATLTALHHMFRERKVEKVYYALTQGIWRPEEQEVNDALTKHSQATGECRVRRDEEGKSARSVFTPIRVFNRLATFVEVRIDTGRTHQIRVHAASRNHPIAGDDKYGHREFNRQIKLFGLKRLFLHAAKIQLSLPYLKKPLCIKAPLEMDLQVVLDQLELACETGKI